MIGREAAGDAITTIAAGRTRRGDADRQTAFAATDDARDDCPAAIASIPRRWAPSAHASATARTDAAQRVLLHDLRGRRHAQGDRSKPSRNAAFAVHAHFPARAASAAAGPASTWSPYRPVTSVGADLAAIDTDVDGIVTITVEAEEAGEAPNLSSATVLTWSSAPTGFAATDTATALVRRGENAETDAALRERLLDRRRERPASGNRAEWRERERVVAGVGDAVYPRTHIDGLDTWLLGTPGCIVIEPLGPAPADDAYVQNGDGTLGAGLAPGLTRVELFPATSDPDNVDIRPAAVVPVTARVRLATEPSIAPWPWGQTSSSLRNVVSATTTALTLDDVTGIVANRQLAVNVGTAYIQGGWWVATVASVMGSVVTLATPLPVAPSGGPTCGRTAGSAAPCAR